LRLSKDYVFSVIERLGRAIAKKADEVSTAKGAPGSKVLGTVRCYQKSVADELWHIQKKVAYGDITLQEAMERLHRLSEHNNLVEDEWKTLLRSIVV
jgi:hypothetical protein